MCNGVFGKITDRPILGKINVSAKIRYSTNKGRYDLNAIWDYAAGILSQEFKEEEALKYLPDTNYIAASYVKAVEAAGARVAPILVRKNLAYYKLVYYLLEFHQIYISSNFLAQYFKIISDSCFVP